MIVTIHQPEHMPYFGFLDKVNKADVFVILDDVQFKKNNFQNRNQILTHNGPKWLSIPVQMKNVINKNINNRKTIANWKETYRNKLVHTYKKHAYFDETIEWIDEILLIQSNKLIDYNLAILKTMFKILNIKTEIIYASDLNIQTQKTQRLYDINKMLNATHYLAGQGAIDYLDVDIFKDIKILKHELTHPVYTQYDASTFTPFMSSLDFFMNIGTDKLSRLLNE